MTQQGQGDVVGRSGEWTFTDCLKVAQAGYGEWALNPRNDSATEHLAGTVIISDMMACIAEAFRRALANAPLSSSRGEQGWRETLEWYAEQSRLSRLIHSEGDAGRHALAADGGKRARAVLDAPSVPGSVPTSAEPDEMQILADGVATEVAERNGCWVTCSGCYDTEDGHPTQHYPHSKIFGCDLGNGCSECGGLGVVWDDTDYEDMARYMLSEQSEAVPTSLAGQVPDEILSTIGDWAKWARDWSGSAFIAGDPVDDEAGCRSDLYAGLCRLGNEMLWLGDEVLKLSASPILALSDECVNSLTNKRQIDDTGEMVGVSHQAVDEIHAALVACRSAAPQPTAGGDAPEKADWWDAAALAISEDVTGSSFASADHFGYDDARLLYGIVASVEAAMINAGAQPGNVLSDALSAERARVIEECAKVAQVTRLNFLTEREKLACEAVAAALRALGQQDTGGAG